MWFDFGSNLVRFWFQYGLVIGVWFDFGSNLVSYVTTLKIKVIYNVTYALCTKKVILKLVIMMENETDSSNCTKRFLQNTDADLRSIYTKICSFMLRYGKLCLNF